MVTMPLGQAAASARSFFKRIGQIPTGFKRLFLETKDAVVLYTKKQTQSIKNLRRRDEELIRENFASVQKLIIYFFLQLPPIIGIVPTIVYLRYPRQLLTRHFWSDEEFKSYAVEEYKERRIHAEKLSHLLENIPKIDPKTDETIPSACVTYHLPLQLDKLSAEHIKTLAGANGICSTQFMLNYTPTIVLRSWLKARAMEIALDDRLLANEGLHELSQHDLQTACLRRGLNPCLNPSTQVNTATSTANSGDDTAVSPPSTASTLSSTASTFNSTTTTSSNTSETTATNTTVMTAVTTKANGKTTHPSENMGQDRLKKYLLDWIQSPVSR